MSSEDRALIDEIARSGEGHAPPEGWENQVWRAAHQPAPEAPKKRSYAWAYASSLVAVVALMMIPVMKRQSDSAAEDERDRKAIHAEVSRMKKSMLATDAEIDAAQAAIDKAFQDLEAAKDEEAKHRAIAAQSIRKQCMGPCRWRKERPPHS